MSFGGSHVQTAVQDGTDPVPPASLGLIAAGSRDSPIATNELDRNFRPLRRGKPFPDTSRGLTAWYTD